MITNPILPSPVSALNSQESKARVPAKMLGQDDFLKLLVAQMVFQDPLNPQTDQQFIAQMTQFTALEQTKTTQGEIIKLRNQQRVVEAVTLLDREVVLKDGQTEITGLVSGVIMDKDVPKLAVGGKNYDMADVLSIRMPKPEFKTSN